MLIKLRNKKFAKKIWIVLAIFILPAFLLWGSGSLFENISSRNYVGKAFGKRISVQDFMQALMATRAKLIMQLGEEFFENENEIDLEPLTWDRMVLLFEAKRRKIKVDDKEIADFIQNHPIFQSDNQFDFSVYKRIVEYVFGMKPHQFEEKIKEDLMLSKLHDQITQDIELSEKYIKLAYRREYEQISVDYLTTSLADFQDGITLEEDQIKDYFENNRQEFRKPVSFNLEYLTIENTSTDEQDKPLYNDEQIKQLYEKLRRKKNLEDTARELNLEVQQTGFFSLEDPIPGIGWSMDIINILGALKVGKMLPPIKTTEGWYLVRLKEKSESYIPAYEDIKDQVRESLLRIKSKDLAMKKMKEALEKINQQIEANPKAVSIRAVARKFNLKDGKTELFKRNSYIPGIGSSDIFFRALPKIEEGAISKIIEMNEGMFIARISKIIPIEEEKFEEEKETFGETLLLKERENRFIEFLFKLRKKANLEIKRELSI